MDLVFRNLLIFTGWYRSQICLDVKKKGEEWEEKGHVEHERADKEHLFKTLEFVFNLSPNSSCDASLSLFLSFSRGFGVVSDIFASSCYFTLSNAQSLSIYIYICVFTNFKPPHNFRSSWYWQMDRLTINYVDTTFYIETSLYSTHSARSYNRDDRQVLK